MRHLCSSSNERLFTSSFDGSVYACSDFIRAIVIGDDADQPPRPRTHAENGLAQSHVPVPEILLRHSLLAAGGPPVGGGTELSRIYMGFCPLFCKSSTRAIRETGFLAGLLAWLLQLYPIFIWINRDSLTIVLVIRPSRVFGLPV